MRSCDQGLRVLTGHKEVKETGSLPAVLVVLYAVVAATSASTVSAAPSQLPARLGFIVFCKTSMAEVTARLGPGKILPYGDPDITVGRGWYHHSERVLLLVHRIGDAWHRNRGLRGAPPALMATLAAGNHLQAYLRAYKLNVADLERPRLSLTSLRGPNGIRLGDSRATVFRAVGASEFDERRGNFETYSYFNLRPNVRRAGCGDAGFIMTVTFTDGRLTRIEILEAS